MRRGLDGVTGATSQPALRVRRLLLLAAGALVLSVLLQAETAGADGCDSYRQACVLTGQNFCGGPRIAGCLNVCCPDAGCCLFYDAQGVNGAQCCPSDPNFDAACNPGCEYKCKRPCGPRTCCFVTLNQECIPATDPNGDGTCCPAVNVCGKNCCDTGVVCLPSSVSGDQTCCPAGQACNGKCCGIGEVCTPAGTCCPAAQVCGLDDECCGADKVCVGLGICCPAAQVCGQNCCTEDQRCRKHKRKHACKRKKKGKKK